MLSDHSKTAKPSSRAKSRYFLTWRWHFYAGLFVIPFMLMLSVTGLRRPVGQGKLGVPAKFASDGVWKTALVTLVVIGVLFPLAGASIVVALLLDWLLFNRVERLKTTFS